MTKKGYKKHKELIEAWVNGAEIQIFNVLNEWGDVENPMWNENSKYRIKPYEFKQGERILVKNHDDKIWREKTFCFKNKKNNYVCIMEDDNEWQYGFDDYNNYVIETCLWKHAKPLKDAKN